MAYKMYRATSLQKRCNNERKKSANVDVESEDISEESMEPAQQRL